MDQPWIYMCAPSRSPLPPPSPVVQGEVSQKEKNEYITAYIWNLERGYDEPIYKAAVEILTENRLVNAGGEGEGGMH